MISTERQIKGITLMEQLCIFVLLLLIATDASQDQWQAINQGEPSTVIAVNNKALYAITSSNLMQVIHDDTGFSLTDGSHIIHIGVNEDNDIWITTSHHKIFYRLGVTSSNLKGTGWELIPGGLHGISTGRYGLVFGYNIYRNVYTRTGQSPSNHKGTSWHRTYGANVNDIACTKRVCFVTTLYKNLYTTSLLQNIDSPLMSRDWIHMDSNVIGIAAYGDKKVWKIDSNGAIWEAVNVYDENLIHLNWVRQSYEEGKFKDVSITDKYAFAVHDSGNIYVQTGCSIFDFEDDDISEWLQTGTAFEKQPVVSQTTIRGVPGKFGERCIDTFSKRKTYEMPDNDTSSQGDGPTGTVLSPEFQIRTDVLHFAVGGGSHPNNYVGLMVDNSEVRQSSGKSVERSVSGSKVRLSRYWWDVSEYKGKCGQIKVHDLNTGNWGHTLFDDLRSSPPCAKGMDVLITANQGDDVSVGQRLVYDIKLKGFYTSSLRALKIEVSFPVTNNNSFIIMEGMNVTWTYCKKVVNLTSERRDSNGIGHIYSMVVSLTRLLSDATVQIVAKAYDHNDLRVGYAERTWMKVGVDFGGDYAKVDKRQITSRRYGNESAKLILEEGIVDLKDYLIGDNITVKVDLSHSYNESLQRAYKVTIRLLVPKYVTILDVSGLMMTLGDVVDIQESMATVRIAEIEVFKTRSIIFGMRLDGYPYWMTKPGKNYSGEILIDAVYYCPRKDCRNRFGNGTEVVTLLKNKFHNFTFHSKKLTLMDPKAGFSRIRGGNGSITLICGDYGQESKVGCFYWDTGRGVWHGLSSVMRNISYYDEKKKEVYGVTRNGGKVKVYGEKFEKHLALNVDEWNVAAGNGSGDFVKAENLSIDDVVGFKEGISKYQGYCC